MSIRRDFKWHGDAVKVAERLAAARGLMLAAEHVLTEANKIVPIQESTLLKSGHAWPPSQVGFVGGGSSEMKSAVTYDTPYAVRQHEELSYSHDSGRQAKYLESTLNAERGAVNDLIAREIKSSLGA